MQFVSVVAAATRRALAASALLVVASCVGYLDVDAGADAQGDSFAHREGGADVKSPPSGDASHPGDAVARRDAMADTSVSPPGDATVEATPDSTSPPPHDASADAPPPPVDAGCTRDRYACAVLADEPVAYARFDEQDVTVPALDSTGNGCGGTYPTFGVSLDTGAIPGDTKNRAAFLDGSGSGITMKACSTENFSSAMATFTVEFWIEPTPSDAGDDTVFILDHEDATFMPRGGWEVDLAGGDIELELYANDENLGVGNTTTQPVTVGSWHYIAMTYDGTNPTAVVYVDGVLTDHGAITGGALPVLDPQVGWQIGKQNCVPCGGANFVGGVDELAIYAKTLTETQVKAHYMAAVGP